MNCLMGIEYFVESTAEALARYDWHLFVRVHNSSRENIRNFVNLLHNFSKARDYGYGLVDMVIDKGMTRGELHSIARNMQKDERVVLALMDFGNYLGDMFGYDVDLGECLRVQSAL